MTTLLFCWEIMQSFFSSCMLQMSHKICTEGIPSDADVLFKRCILYINANEISFTEATMPLTMKLQATVIHCTDLWNLKWHSNVSIQMQEMVRDWRKLKVPPWDHSILSVVIKNHREAPYSLSSCLLFSPLILHAPHIGACSEWEHSASAYEVYCLPTWRALSFTMWA